MNCARFPSLKLEYFERTSHQCVMTLPAPLFSNPDDDPIISDVSDDRLNHVGFVPRQLLTGQKLTVMLSLTLDPEWVLPE